MAKKKTITLQIEPELEQQAAALFEELGMDLDTATGIFYRQALRYHGLPFDVCVDKPNAETIAAIQEVQEMKKNPERYKSYTNVDEMMKELLA